MRKLTFINLEYNAYNGFMFEILNIELQKFEGALFGVYICDLSISFDVCFINILFRNPFNF